MSPSDDTTVAPFFGTVRSCIESLPGRCTIHRCAPYATLRLIMSASAFVPCILRSRAPRPGLIIAMACRGSVTSTTCSAVASPRRNEVRRRIEGAQNEVIHLVACANRVLRPVLCPFDEIVDLLLRGLRCLLVRQHEPGLFARHRSGDALPQPLAPTWRWRKVPLVDRDWTVALTTLVGSVFVKSSRSTNST